MLGATAVNTILVTLGVLILALAVVLVTLTVRRRVRSEEPAALGTSDTWLVSLVGAGALLAIPLALWGLVSTAVQTFTAPSVRVNDLPMSGGYPEVLAASDAPVDAGYSAAWIDVANLPVQARALLWLERALPLVTGLAIAVSVAWLALALLRGAPFTRRFPVVLLGLSVVVTISGLGAQVAGASARAETIAFLGSPRIITGEGGFAAYVLGLDLAPIGWGLGIALVAAAFAIGTRLQRETKGLI